MTENFLEFLGIPRILEIQFARVVNTISQTGIFSLVSYSYETKFVCSHVVVIFIWDMIVSKSQRNNGRGERRYYFLFTRYFKPCKFEATKHLRTLQFYK